MLLFRGSRGPWRSMLGAARRNGQRAGAAPGARSGWAAARALSTAVPADALPSNGPQETLGKSPIDLMNDPATVQAAFEAAGKTDPLRSELTYWPVDLMTAAIDTLHVSAGLPWWGAIVATTFTFRAALLPLHVRQLKSTLRMQYMQPEMTSLQEEMKLRPAGTVEEQQKYALRMKEIQNKHGVSVFGTLLGPLAQIPIFLTMFWTLQRMATDYPSLSNGGVLWFPNLSEVDATYALPALCSISFLATIEASGSDTPHSSPEMAARMKMVMRGMALVMFPITATMPSAVALYWLTTNCISVVQSLFFKIPGVKPLLGVRLLPGIEPIARGATHSDATKVTATPETSVSNQTVFSSPPKVSGTRSSRRKRRSERRT
mmetsp:Transcript_7561/g.13193  ORF Transcript_7561/g.13193 Transcript_7561/m.13193 type:complete len:375 (+) Transcript_7561:79-1203(+)